MGIKRRAFLIGGAAIAGAGVFAVVHGASSARRGVKALTSTGNDGNFLTWLRIGADDSVTVFSPHIDFGQGSQTALAQMAADELDADWAKVRVEQAPADPAFANIALGRGFLAEMSGAEGVVNIMPDSILGLLARSMDLQITGGSSAVRFTGNLGMRVAGAAARLALIAEAAERMGVSPSTLTTANSIVSHAATGRTLRYGELAEAAAKRALSDDPPLKPAARRGFIGKPVHRFDIPGKVDGSAQYGIDVALPGMRVATLMAAPARGGKLISVDPAPAMAVAGVEKVIKLEDAVAVVAKGYWQAIKGLRALSPQFSDGGHGALSSESIFAAQAELIAGGNTEAPAGAKVVEAEYRVPFLHQMMMEPWALTAHHKNGKIELWGGTQGPLATRSIVAKASGLDFEDVTIHAMIMGGGFGRRNPDYSQIIGQVTQLAMQLPYPVKLIWSREEEVKQGAYRPQSSARIRAVVEGGKITSWRNDYAQYADAAMETRFPYAVGKFELKHHKYISNQVDAYWRSVNSTQMGFYNETMIDALAHEAGADPLAFRLAHLADEPRYRAVLEAVAKRSGWGTPLPPGTGRGIAVVESFGTIVAEVIEASLNADGTPKVHRAWAAVDCGTVVNPLNAEAQIQGGIIMGLSAAIGEAITLDKGAVVESSFPDYPVFKLAEAPSLIDVQFIESGATMGGIGEPGLPPAAPALANALFAVSGKRIRTLPIRDSAKA